MAYQPLEGWVEVSKNARTGAVLSQRLHADRECAERAIAIQRTKRLKDGSPVEAYLSVKMPYGQARALKGSTVCKCSRQRPGEHAVKEGRPYLEILQGPPGSGRRR